MLKIKSPRNQTPNTENSGVNSLSAKETTFERNRTIKTGSNRCSAMITEGITQAVEKLDEHNYEVWKLQMRSVLVCNELWGYVSGTHVRPENVSELSAWKTKDEKALALIVLAVTSGELRHIGDSETSKSAWDEFEKHHKLKKPAKKAVLCRELIQMRKTVDQTMSNYVHEFTEKTNLLDKMGVKISSDLITVMLLNSLPQEYENLRTAVESRVEIPTLENLKSKLFEEEERLQGAQRPMTKSLQGSQMSLASTMEGSWKGYTKQENTAPIFPRRCYVCDRYGHRAVHCTERDGEKERSGAADEPLTVPSFPGRCFVCEKFGHRAVDCRDDRKNGREKNGAEEKEVIQPEVAWVLKVFGDEEWHLDIGVTSHVCNDRKKFAELNEEGDSGSEGGGGKSNAVSNVRGTVLMKFNVNGKKIIASAGNTKYQPNSKNNLYSVPRLIELGCTVKFFANNAFLVNQRDETIAIAERKLI